jgi:Big-like domain-containing protein/TIR domain-containing protein/NHL repeat-containing protein
VKIFISYSRRDASDFAQKISDTLGDEHNIFTDIDDIQLGDIWSNSIEENIASCDIFLVIVTFSALKSPEVEKELMQARTKNKKIIPCFYNRIPSNEIKWGLEKLQGIEFASENQLARDIYWKIHQYQNKVPPKLDPIIEPTINSTREPELGRVKEKMLEPIKAEIQTDMGSPGIPQAKLPKLEVKYRFNSKRTIVILVAIGVIIAGMISVYVSVYMPQQVKVNVTKPPQPTTTTSPKAIAGTEQRQYSFVRGWSSLCSNDDQKLNGTCLTSVAVDSSREVFVAGTVNRRVEKFTSDGTFITKWGSTGSGEGHFDSPSGVAVDSSGDVYVADWGNIPIQKFTSNGTFITKWGSTGSTQDPFGGTSGVAVDSSGDVYVAHHNNNLVQKFTSDGTFITKWGSSGSGEGHFDSPSGVAVDSSDNVYIADAGNKRIQKFTSNGTFITKWGSVGIGDGQFNEVSAVAVDSSGDVYVADGGNNRIQKFTSNGTFITKWGSAGSGEGQFKGPNAIAVGSSGDVYVTDTGSNRIQVFKQVITESNNHSPNAIDKSFTTSVNTPVSITLLASDKDNDNLTASVQSSPLHGQLSAIDQNDGSLTYTPNSGFTGIDKFTFKVNDGKVDSNIAAVSIRVK